MGLSSSEAGGQRKSSREQTGQNQTVGDGGAAAKLSGRAAKEQSGKSRVDGP